MTPTRDDFSLLQTRALNELESLKPFSESILAIIPPFTRTTTTEDLDEIQAANLRVRIINAAARKSYPDYPTLVEWAMLRSLAKGTHRPVSALILNIKPKEPKYSAIGFRQGTVLPGKTGKLYRAIGGSWLLLRDHDYTPAGNHYAMLMLADIEQHMHEPVQPVQPVSSNFKYWVFH